jgi:hypothetical protein
MKAAAIRTTSSLLDRRFLLMKMNVCHQSRRITSHTASSNLHSRCSIFDVGFPLQTLKRKRFV